MNERRSRYWARYMGDLVDRLGLSNAHIILDEDPCSDGKMAETTCYYQRNLAEVSLAEKWEYLSPEDQRETMIHELLHIHLNRLDSITTRIIENHAPKKAQEALIAIRADAAEVLVDTLAELIAPFYPLPPERKTRKS